MYLAQARATSSIWPASSLVGVTTRAAGRLARSGVLPAPSASAGSRDALQGGQDEGGRLAGAGLGATQEVASLQGERDGLLLDGGGVYVAEVLYSPEEAWFQAKFSETHKAVAPCRASRWMHCDCRRS